MRLIVDTCTFLWLCADDPTLSVAVRAAVAEPDNPVWFSAISAWEISIKYSLGRLALPLPPTEYVATRREWLRIESLPFDEAAGCREVSCHRRVVTAGQALEIGDSGSSTAAFHRGGT
jgi:PIN domain nuclease of toxin-antitoxin system